MAVGRAQREHPSKKIKQLMMSLLRICNVNVRTETTFHGFSSSQPQWNGQVGSVASLHPNLNGTDRWAEGKTNTSYRMYRSLYSCGVGTLSYTCTRVFLHRPEVSHHDSDHLVEGHSSSP
jgi:hypothetical protein